jgi:hypothetical protein
LIVAIAAMFTASCAHAQADLESQKHVAGIFEDCGYYISRSDRAREAEMRGSRRYRKEAGS